MSSFLKTFQAGSTAPQAASGSTKSTTSATSRFTTTKSSDAQPAAKTSFTTRTSTDSGAGNMAGSALRTKSPVKPTLTQPPAMFGAPKLSGAASKLPPEPQSPGPEDIEKVNAWQAEMDNLEQTQMQIQNDQMNLLHSQIHILMRELGDLQKHAVALTQKVEDDGAALQDAMAQMKVEIQDAAQEAHAAIRLELAEHGNNATELKNAMNEAHEAMSKAMQDGLNDVTQAHADALDAHASAHGETIASLEAKLTADLQQASDGHANALQAMNDAHHEKHALNSEAMENGLNGVLESAHGKLQEELDSLRHGGAGSLTELSKILADVTEQVDKIDQAVETEQQLRLEVEKKLDEKCAALSAEVAVAMEEAHSALKLEMAELGGNQDAIKDAMADAHQALKDEWAVSHGALAADMASHREELDAAHGNMRDAMQAMNDEHHEKHAANAAAMEEGIANVLGGSHAALQDDLAKLKAGGAGSLQELSKIVADVTSQVDNIDQAVEQEHALRLAVEEKLDQMFNDNDKVIEELKKDMQVALKESHAALKVELAEHGGTAQDIKAAMIEANAALKSEMTLAHGSLKNELGALNQAHEKKHKEHKENMDKLNSSHHAIHAQNAQNLENSIQDALSTTHNKLQDELKILKSGGAGSLKDLSKILADVTQQVDNIDQSLNKEHELRMAVEAKLDKMFNDQDTVIANLEKRVKGTLDDHIQQTAVRHRGLEDAMNQMNDDHNDRHAQNSAAMEESINNVLGGSHAKLQDDLKLLKSGGAGSLKDLSKILADVTKQVDQIDQAVEREHNLRLAVEDRLDKKVSEDNKTLADLKKDMQVALKESHSALKLELAEHGGKAEDIKAALSDAHAALKDEMNLAHGSLKNELSSLNKEHEKKHKAHQDNLKQINDKHQEIHAQNSEKLENAIKDGLSSTHNKLQEELKILKSGGAGSLKDLSKILADVTQQVDNIDKALNSEHELRMKVENKLDKMFNDQDAVIDKMKKELGVALKESHSALRLELAEHGKNANEIKAAMAEAHGALKDELALHKGNLDKHGKAHAGNMAEMERKLRGDLSKMQDDHKDLKENVGAHASKHLEHAQNSAKMEAGVHSTLQNTHQKLQAELRELQSGHGTSISGMRDILTDVTKQVDVLTEQLDKEHELRMAVEGRVDSMIQELRKENEAALKEAHAALRLEMGALDKNSNEIRAAMMDAHKALKMEHGAVSGDIMDKLDSHGKSHGKNLADMEQMLRGDLGRAANDLDTRHRELKDAHSKHAAGLTTLDQRLALLEQASSDKHRDAFKEIQGAHGKINELLGSLQSHRGKIDLAHGSLEERLSYCERTLKEKADAQNALHGQFRGEALTREKTMTGIDMRLSKMETYFTELADRNAKELEGANGRYRELHSKFDQMRGLTENHKNLVEQRLQHLDRSLLDSSDSHAHALSSFHNEHGKEISHVLQAERMAREAQEKTFLDYIQDARQQKEALEATVQEQLRLERVAREVQANQIKDAINHSHNFAGNAEYTDILLQERSSREASERALERRLESFERAISMERNERAQELQRIWDAFDGHTHEAMSPIVREIEQPRVKVIQSPRTITPSYVETVSTQPTLPTFNPTERIIVPETAATTLPAPITTRSVTASPAMTPMVPMTSASRVFASQTRLM